MYVPGPFRVDDPELIRQVVRANPFAMLVSVQDGIPLATHLPVLLIEEDGRDVLVGHVARANPHWRSFGSTALMVFAGPHGYVSPAWYQTAPNVPTWNYVAVHGYGVPEITEGDVAISQLRSLVDTFDPELGRTNPESTEIDFLRKKLAGIVAFRMPIERWEAKAKLNQNKTEADRLAVREKFSQSADQHERAMAEMMPA